LFLNCAYDLIDLELEEAYTENLWNVHDIFST